MAIRTLKVEMEGSLAPALMQHEGQFVPALDIDDVTGQIYSAGVPIGTIQATCSKTSYKVLQPIDILNLKAVPVQILPAPGVGKVIAVEHIFLQYKFVTTPYSNVGNNDVTFYWDAASISSPYAEFNSNGFLDQTVSHLTNVAISVVGTHQPNAENQPLMLSHSGGVSEFSGGDGLLLVSTTYRFITLS